MELQIVFWLCWLGAMYLLSADSGERATDLLEAVVNLVVSFFIALFVTGAYAFLYPALGV